MSASREYLLASQQPGTEARLGALAALFDPVTFRHLEAVGVSTGWRCWEVGAGGPSVAAWLAERVGASGRVLATDIDTRWLAGRSDFEVVNHDLRTQPAPESEFDLIHARLVLVHVAERQAALQTLVNALRPGGWLVLEDADPGLQPLLCPDESGPEEQLANRLRSGFRVLMQQRGADLQFGRTLPRLLRQAGLQDVCADAYFPIASPECVLLELATIQQIRAQLVDGGLATEQEVERHIANVTTGQLDLATAPLISAWGRRPE